MSRESRLVVEIKLEGEGRVPVMAKPGSSGYDLYSNKEIIIPPLGRALVPTGVFLAIPETFEAQVRPRSGLALKDGLTVLNTPGTIDASYRGEVGVIMFNTTNKPVGLHKGTRIAQLVFTKVETVFFSKVKELPTSERGAGGFGHSGTGEIKEKSND